MMTVINVNVTLQAHMWPAFSILDRAVLGDDCLPSGIHAFDTFHWYLLALGTRRGLKGYKNEL